MRRRLHVVARWRSRRLLWGALLVALGVMSAALVRTTGTADPSRVAATARSESSSSLPLTLRVEPAVTGPNFSDGAVGLSLEAAELPTSDLSAGHAPLVALMRLLGPGVLRIGGNSVDTSWWSSAREPPPTWATSVITPADLVRLNGLLTVTHWSVILGVNLGHFDPARAADEAAVATRILGPRLTGFEIGNEPDLYGGSGLRLNTYSVQSFLQELAAYTAAMRVAAPAMRLYGPDVSQPAWLTPIEEDAPTSFAVITDHFYPTVYSFESSACAATPIPSAADLLSRQVRRQESVVLRELVAAGAIAHLETRLSETNSTGSCDAPGGPATSPVFASALWALDWILRSAAFGVSGMNFHGWLGVCGTDTVSPLCAPTLRDDLSGHVQPRPEYYGLLAARQLEGGHVIAIRSHGGGGAEDVTAYATLHPDHTITMAVLNFSTSAHVTLALEVPGYSRATEETLAALSIHATRGVTFGGASATATGGLRPKPGPMSRRNGRFRLQMAPASAWIVTLHR